ncbi:hypothetical protein EB796_007627 [Bugula neritina]|uniref:Uncharacterized protein n=1 Tax=Bugula neritina TaxID=10212 RepID=A0A7J7K7A3_BUGNE|nr:hypothetical protein EB796_007627 [Bugula neritina]
MNTKLISATEYDVWIATTWVPKGSNDEYVKIISEGHSFKDSSIVIGLSVGLSLAIVVIMVLTGVNIRLIRNRSVKSDESFRIPPAKDGSNRLEYEIVSPTVSATANQPTYINKTFEKEDASYEVLNDQPTAPDHVYAAVSN